MGEPQSDLGGDPEVVLQVPGPHDAAVDHLVEVGRPELHLTAAL